MIKVLFVCLGNICRSPAAEGVFLHLLEERGLSDQFVVDSAGTGGWHVGNPRRPAHAGRSQPPRHPAAQPRTADQPGRLLGVRPGADHG